MNKENFIFCREVCTSVHPEKGYKLRVDNDFAIDTRKEYVHCDDDRELITQIYRNDNAVTGGTRPFRIVCYEYGEIQHFEIDACEDEIVTMATKLGFSSDQIDRLRKSIILTAEDYADSVSDQVKGRSHDIISG